MKMVLITSAIKLLIASLILLFLSLSCFAVSFIWNVWWVTKMADTETISGLWKTCVTERNETHCKSRGNIFKFDKERGTDPIIVCLLLSAFFVFLIIVMSICMVCCCRKSLGLWQKLAKWNAIFGIIAVVGSVDAMLYTEFEFNEVFNEGTRGWAYMTAWIGTGLQIIAYILLLCQLCIKTYMPVNRMQAW